MSVKWSDISAFPDGQQVQVGDSVVGLRSGANYKFSFPSTGLKDENGNFLIGWSTVGGLATDYLTFSNGQSGVPLKVSATGTSSDIDVQLISKGLGKVNALGLFTVNGSVEINGIIDDDTMVSASNTNVPTSESVVAYIASTPGGAGGANGNLQYNNGGTLDGDSGTITDGAGNIVVTGSVSIDNVSIDGNNIFAPFNENLNLSTSGTGELFFNGVGWESLTDGQLFIGSTGNTPVGASLTAGTGISVVNAPGSITISATATAAGGSNTQMQYNNAGLLDGDPNFTTDGSGGLTLVGSFDIDNLQINGNTIFSTNANGDINFSPDGTGQVNIDGVGWSSMTDGQLFIGSTNNVPTKASLTGGNGMTVTGGSGSITLDVRGGGLDWTEVTGTSANMSPNKGYIANNAALVSLLLPATSAIGDTIKVLGKGAGKWRITQNAGQTILYSDKSTTTGAAGSLTTAKQYDSIELICITANTDWIVRTAPTMTLTPV